MKKPHISSLVMLTAVFAAFTLGLFLGRNQTSEPITLSVSQALADPFPAASTPVPQKSPVSGVFPVNVNTADKETLMTLPGIGEILAQRILDYRTVNGPFTAPEGLMYVEGIGQGRMEEIWDLIIIGG